MREIPAWAHNLIHVPVSSRELDTLCDALPPSHPSPSSVQEVDTAIKTHFPPYLALISALCSIRRNPSAVPPVSWEQNMSGSYRPFLWLADCIAGILEFEHLWELCPWVVEELDKAEDKARDVASLDRPLWEGHYDIEVWYYHVPSLVKTLERVLSVVEGKGKVKEEGGKTVEVRR
jgi:hypothetical protein